MNASSHFSIHVEMFSLACCVERVKKKTMGRGVFRGGLFVGQMEMFAWVKTKENKNTRLQARATWAQEAIQVALQGHRQSKQEMQGKLEALQWLLCQLTCIFYLNSHAYVQTGEEWSLLFVMLCWLEHSLLFLKHSCLYSDVKPPKNLSFIKTDGDSEFYIKCTNVAILSLWQPASSSMWQ